MFNFSRPKDAIWARMVFWLAVVLLFGGLLGYYFQTKYEGVIQAKREKLDHVANSLQLRLNGSLMAVQLLASDADISSLHDAAIKPKLKNALLTLGLQNAALFDVNGQLIIDANGTHTAHIYDLMSFLKARNGQAVISNRIISDELKTSYISLRVPVFSNNQIRAVLAAAIPVSELSKLVYREEVPEGQYIFIMDEDGQFIHHPRLNEVYPEQGAFMQHVFPMPPLKTVTLVTNSVLDHIDKVFIYQQLEHATWRITYAVPVRTVYHETLLAAAPDLFVFFLLIAFIALTYHYIRAANRNREMKDLLKLERLLAATEIAAGIAHEVRNPLTSIKGFLQLMMQKEDRTNFNSYLEIMLGEIERIDALIGEFQRLARPLRQPNLGLVDLGKVVADVVLLMSSQAEQRQVALEYSAQGDLFSDSGIWARADIPQLKQVLINLLKNAFDALSPGGRVRISLARVHDIPSITIEDNGAGIAPEVIEKLGTPFFTTKEGGTGLGLSICYTIIHNHGGKINVASKVGEGTSFTLLFPPAKEAN